MVLPLNVEHTIVENVRNKEVLRRIGTIKKLLLTTKKKQLKVVGCITRKERIENLTRTGQIRGKTK